VSCSKNKQKDIIAKKATSDSLSIYLRLSTNELNPEKRNLLLQKAFEKVNSLENDSITRTQLLEICVGFLKDNNWENFKES
jgi:hypothetical protein